MITVLRASACLVLAAAAFLQLGGTAIAVAPSPEPRAFEPDCNPCIVVVDKPAWDETQTVVDVAAWDETVTVIDVPATTGTKTVIDAPARAVAHHDLVSAAHDVTTSTWVPETTNQWNTTSGAWMDTFVPAVSGLLYMPFSCWWEWDDGGRYRECDGGYYYGAIITPAHYENLWHQGHYVYQALRECDDTDWGVTCYFAGYGYQWYEGPFWEAVDTSHYVYTTTHYDAVYSDWIEQLPALTHTETYPIPAVTHQTTVHHAALTHTALVHHDAVTHQEQALVVLSQSSQGSTSGENANVPNTSATTPVRIPVVSTITLIDKPASTRTVTITDAPAYSTQRTVVDQAAYDQAVQRPIYDVECDDNGHCHRYIDDWETIYVHHDAVTHQETVQVPAVTHLETQTIAAVTHQQTLRYDAAVALSPEPSSSESTDALIGFGMLLGLTALAGAGRFASSEDALRTALAEWTGRGNVVPRALSAFVADGQVTDADATAAVETIVEELHSVATGTDSPPTTPGPDAGSSQTLDTPPSGKDMAGARADFNAWLGTHQDPPPGGDGGGGGGGDPWSRFSDGVKRAARETLYGLGNGLYNADDAALHAIYNADDAALHALYNADDAALHALYNADDRAIRALYDRAGASYAQFDINLGIASKSVVVTEEGQVFVSGGVVANPFDLKGSFKSPGVDLMFGSVYHLDGLKVSKPADQEAAAAALFVGNSPSVGVSGGYGVGFSATLDPESGLFGVGHGLTTPGFGVSISPNGQRGTLDDLLPWNPPPTLSDRAVSAPDPTPVSVPEPPPTDSTFTEGFVTQEATRDEGSTSPEPSSSYQEAAQPDAGSFTWDVPEASIDA